VVRSPEKRRAWESELRGGALNDAMAASRARVRLPTSGDDEVSRICFQVAFFKENAGGFDLLTDENVGAFVQACREVFGQMEEEVKERLGSMLEQGRLQHAVYERGALVKRPPNDDTCADAFPFKTHEELVRELGHEDAMVYQSEGVQVRKERVIPLSEVQAAFARGEVARVDATQLLPGWLLNASLPDLAARYPTAAKTAPCNGAYIDDEPLHHREPGRLWFHYGRSQDCHSALEDFTNQFPVWGPDSPEVQMGLRVLLPSLIPRECKSYPTLAEIASWTASFGDSELGRSVPYELFFNRTLPLETKKEFKRTVERHQALPCCQVNARRLPGFPEALNFAEKLGVGHLVSHTHSFVWPGSTPGQFHVDEWDNVQSQATGSCDVIIFPPRCSGSIKMPLVEGHLDWRRRMREQKPGNQYAWFFHMRLKAGEGVVIPSNAFHKIISRDNRRLAVNSFLEPKFGKMQWPGNPAHQFAINSRDMLAARRLWVESLSHLWDTKKISMFMRTLRVEMI